MGWVRRAQSREDGTYLGQVEERARRGGQVYYPDSKHLICVGGSGAGKGTGIIIPALAQLQRSILLIDPNGEAAAITARRRMRFGRGIVLNPFSVLLQDCPHLQSQGFNPPAAL